MLAILVLYAATAAFLAGATKFPLTLDPLPGTPAKRGIVALMLLAHPGITEELAFRYLLSDLLGPYACQLLFIAAHPLAALFLSPSCYATFSSGAFLVQVALLGAACSALAEESILYSILLHWIVVLVWTMALGGYKCIGRAEFFQKFVENPKVAAVVNRVDAAVAPAVDAVLSSVNGMNAAKKKGY
jgi:predicted Abi (CAAX) family protease